MAETMEAPAAAPEVIPANTEAPTSEPSGWMGNTGDFGDNAPEVIKSLMDTKKWTNVEQLANGYNELESFKGGPHAIPEADDAEGWAKINSARGVPESADKYEYAAAEGSPELSPELMDGFKTFAHGANLSQDQMAKIVDFQLDSVAEQTKIYDQQEQDKADADVAATKAMYGINYDNAIRDADLIANKHGFAADIEAEGIKGVPIITKLLNHIANLEAEDGIGTGAPAEAAKSLNEQLEDIKANPAFMDRFHKGHKPLMVVYNDLNRKIAQSRQA